jgi:uncharacterized protein (DUF924 family)
MTLTKDFPRNMWGGGIWFETAEEARQFARWVFDQGIMVQLHPGGREVRFYRPPEEVLSKGNMQVWKQSLLDDWKAI